MPTDLVRHSVQLPSTVEWKQMLEMADVFLKSGFLPDAIKTPQAAVTIIAKGRELGLPPLYALSNIGIIKGKPVTSAECMLAMIYRDHGDGAVQVLETNAKECRVAYKRRGGERAEFAFTIADAERAGLAKQDNYIKYTPAMLRSRCFSAMARMAFPDTIGGLYTAEELGARVVVDADGQVVLDDTGAADDALIAALEPPAQSLVFAKHAGLVKTAKSLAELQAVWTAARVERDQMFGADWTEINRLTNERKAEFPVAAPEPEAEPVSA